MVKALHETLHNQAENTSLDPKPSPLRAVFHGSAVRGEITHTGGSHPLRRVCTLSPADFIGYHSNCIKQHSMYPSSSPYPPPPGVTSWVASCYMLRPPVSFAALVVNAVKWNHPICHRDVPQNYQVFQLPPPQAEVEQSTHLHGSSSVNILKICVNRAVPHGEQEATLM